MEQNCLQVLIDGLEEGLEQLIYSNAAKPEEFSKVKVRLIQLKGKLCYQATEYRGQKVFHSNYGKEELAEKFAEWLEAGFKQVEMQTVFAQTTILISKKGKATIKRKAKKEATPFAGVQEHNRKKRYLLEEGVAVPFLVDLGVMTAEGKVVKAKYDKYRQINRFLEFIEDILPELPQNKELRILDFGCGKSYLTFAVYYYLKVLNGYPVRITGLDLKTDVIETCSKLAKKYGYEELEFLQGDIAGYDGTNQVDMVITLHACDTATDYALHKAVDWGASVILSVPCCQHEWNKQMQSEAVEDFTRYGIIKERMAALMTDAFRADLLEACGYRTQILEFIDMEHTPKNLLLRAVKDTRKGKRTYDKEKALRLMEAYHVEPTLFGLLEGYIKE